jgi:outer membrane protein OmpA-like peptidoglycan-associated protein
MASRFGERTVGRRASDARGVRDIFGEWWSAIAVVGLAGMAVLALAGGATPAPSGRVDTAPEILAALGPAERSLAEVDRAFAELCQDPVLLALELEPDCETGAITLADGLFDGFGGSQLRPEIQEDVAAAMTSYLAKLRRLPALWENISEIEIRGHADPRAMRDPYTTNLVGSQQRALGVLLFLIGPRGLSASDREDLQKWATVSGASFSRPPASCPEASRECYSQWRRVEILPVFSEAHRRKEWARTVETIGDIARRPPEKIEANDR